jgi:hypothetical protein
VCFVIGAVCLYHNYVIWGWLFLVVGTYGLAMGMLRVQIEHNRATDLAMIPTILVIVTGFYLNLIVRVRLSWVLALSWSFIATLMTLAGFGLFSSFRSSRVRVIAKSLALIVFSIVLIVVFHLYARELFPLDVILIFLAADNLRRGLYELFAGQSPTLSGEPVLFLLPDAIVLILLVGGLVHYRDLLFFHMFSVALVLALFRFSAERFIPKVAARERRKIDRGHSRDSGHPVSFLCR